jgi:molybdopterin molybdotransferase
MRDHSNHITMSRLQAVAAMLSRVTFESASEQVNLRESFGRVLAHDVFSKTQVPNVLTCCMDSIAVHWSDFEDGNMPDTSAWTRGIDWEFANTGVAMPQGFDTAVVIEHVKVSSDEQHVTLDALPSKQYAGTRFAGSTLEQGDLLAHEGVLITPDIAARIASGNHSAVCVRRRPKVAFIPTGDELVSPGNAHVPLGRNLETNSLVVEGKIKTWGGEYLPFDIVADDPNAIGEAVLEACAMSDIVVLNAGSSKGSGDWACEEIERLGDVICHETNHGPGHHSWFALVKGTPIVGISGPSTGASFTLDFYLRPLVMEYLGLDFAPCKECAVLDAPFDKGGHQPGKDGPAQVAGEQRPDIVSKGDSFFSIKFLMAKRSDDGVLHAMPLPGRPGSPATLDANAYYMLENGHDAKQPAIGDVIEIEWR